MPASSIEDHAVDIQRLSAAVKCYHDRQEQFRIYHGTACNTRKAGFDPDRLIEIGHLTRILSFDFERSTVLVEPCVTHGSLVAETLAKNLLPKVVAEFPHVTVGGAFSGTGGQSSSFKFGYFEHTIDWIEMVLMNGDVVTASATENSDLFYGAATTCGTLGVVTLLRVQLIPAKPFIELTLSPRGNVEHVLEAMKSATEDPKNDYIEGLQFGRHRFVVILGRLVDKPGRGARRLTTTRRKDSWYYLEVRRLTKNTEKPVLVVMPIVDYLFRYNRGAFWAGQLAFDYFRLPFNRFTRYCSDRMTYSKQIYHIFQEAKFGERYVVQDFGIPWSASSAFVEYVNNDFEQFPLWLCPFVDVYHDKPTLFSGEGSKVDGADEERGEGSPNRAGLMLNVGIYGPAFPNAKDFLAANRQLEQRVKDIGGQKAFCGCAYYTEAEFWSIYDLDWYDGLRANYGASAAIGIYDKMVDREQLKGLEVEQIGIHDSNLEKKSKENIAGVEKRPSSKKPIFQNRPFPGIYGIWKALQGGDYLLARKRK